MDGFQRIARELNPRIAIVLGSGQSNVLHDLTVEATIHFAEIPGFCAPSTPGHSGKMELGILEGKALLVMRGRLHLYEGHSWDVVGAPVRLAANLGVKNLLLTNAAGGIHPSLIPGSVMVIRDHLFWQRPNSWRGPGPSSCQCILGERPTPYDTRLMELLHTASREISQNSFAGVYAAVTGPCYETPAEIRALRMCGADAVGMSTAFEIELGRSLGMCCAAISIITNLAAGIGQTPLDHREVLQIASQSQERLGHVLSAFAKRC